MKFHIIKGGTNRASDGFRYDTSLHHHPHPILLPGYVLFVASNMISDGSELLLLIPSIAGIVGSCVLPVLGAVPDGMIVLFSGMGPDAQQQLDVGVGALAGSTIM